MTDRTKHYITTAAASSAAGAISKFLIYPIETVKNRVQVRKRSRLYQPGMIGQIVRSMYAEEGIRGFFRGAVFQSLGSIPAICCYMTTYEYCKGQLAEYFKQKPYLNYMVSGFMAELASCFLWLPLDVVKERLQTQSQFEKGRYRDAKDTLNKISREEGKIGLYRSTGGTLAYFGCFSILYFTLYEKMKKTFMKDGEKPTFLKSFLMSSSSGIISGITCNPIDIVKIRMQVDRRVSSSTPEFGYSNIFQGMYKIVKSEGMLALYKGSFMRIWTVGPNTGMIMGLTEYFRRILKQKLA